MRILFRSLPSYGHLYPMMPLAEAARDAGHDVVFATAGDFVGRLQSLGFSVVPAGVTMAQAIADRFGPSVPPTTVDGQTDWDVVGALPFCTPAASASSNTSPAAETPRPGSGARRIRGSLLCVHSKAYSPKV